MKSLIVIMSVLVMSVINPSNEESQTACGIITADVIYKDTRRLSLTIKNNESGNYKTICVDQTTWLNSHVGDEFCIEDGLPW